jgi:seryl-tRNA synthetase
VLDIRFIVDNVDLVRKAIADKHAANEHTDLEKFVQLDQQRRQIQTEADRLAAERNRISKQVGHLMGRRPQESPGAEDKFAAQVAEAHARSKELRARLEELEALGRQVEAQLDEMRSWIPNLPGAGVPEGADGSANVVLHEHGRQARFDFPPLPHYELGVKLGILDCARGGKTSGSGWYFLRGDGSRLERALISWFLDRHRARGYTELFPPFCVTEKALFGSGQIPKLRDEMYAMPRDGLFAIPTAEVPVTNYHADEILDEEDLPIRYCAYSACFRREAGAAGAETRGILRVHQFNKVEILKLTTPETSYAELEKLTRDAEELLEGLGLRYRRVVLCRGDLGFHAAKTYDLEAWAPAAGKWLEVSSCSNFTDYQARRANIRYRPAAGGKPRFVHTLNGSGLALPRLQVALWETFQQPDGSVLIPEVLRRYMDGQERIVPAAGT